MGMKVIEHLSRATGPLISYEIIPPQRGGTLRSLLELIDDLVRFRPPFIDITSHAAEVVYEEAKRLIERKVKRKRPGTLGVCALIQNKYDIDAVPHILCNGFTREETEDALIELRYLGIENVLAVRGDDSGYVKPLRDGKTANRYAIDLVQQIVGMNHGPLSREGPARRRSVRTSASASRAIPRSTSRRPTCAPTCSGPRRRWRRAPTTSSPRCSSTTSTTTRISSSAGRRASRCRSSPG